MSKEAPEAQRAFYKTKAWQKCRAAYIASVGGVCERCKAKGIINPGYIVHHKRYITQDNLNDPSIALSFDNLEYLCLQCHNTEHFGEHKKRRYKIHEDGSIEIR